MVRGWECPRELESLLPLHQTNEPLSDAVPRFSSTAGGKEKAKLKFRRNGIPESWDLFINPCTPKLTENNLLLQFCCVNLTILHKGCACRMLQDSRTSCACLCHKIPFWGQSKGCSMASDRRILISWLLEQPCAASDRAPSAKRTAGR